MKLEVPDDIVRKAEVGAADLYLSLAVQLYTDNRLEHADACRLAGLDANAFNQELLSRHISIQQYPKERRQLKREAG